MATPIPNKFTSYDLSTEEMTSGYMLSPATVHVIRNELSIAAETKLALVVDPNNVQAFVQAEAYQRGKIEFIDWLLAMNDSVTQEHLDNARAIAEQENTVVLNTNNPTSIFGTL